MKITVTDLSGRTFDIEGIEGWTLMECLKKANLPVKAECGGACACATCHVYVDSSWLAKVPAKSPQEEDMLDLAFAIEAGSRLSCQITLTKAHDGIAVRLAPEG